MNNVHIILFYKFIEIEDPDGFAAAQREFCRKEGLLGKLLVAREGMCSSRWPTPCPSLKDARANLSCIFGKSARAKSFRRRGTCWTVPWTFLHNRRLFSCKHCTNRSFDPLREPSSCPQILEIRLGFNGFETCC